MSEQTLYRFFDENNVLLYVGISINAYNRAKQHQADKEWWPDVVQIILEKHPDRSSVELREKEVIAAESPLYNVSFNKPKSTIPSWDELAELANQMTGEEILQATQRAFFALQSFRTSEDTK
jgi:hypothetical protein